MFVLTGDSNSNEINLYALDQQTGNTVWGPVLVPRGSYWWAAAAYDNGTIFVTPDGSQPFGNGAMYAYSASTGQLLWSATLSGQYLFSSPPAALNGFVYTVGAGGGGTVYAVDEQTGNTVWTASVANGDNSSPALTASGVFVSYVCPQVYRFNSSNGTTTWHYSPGCDGGGGNTPVLFGNLLYVRDSILIPNYNGIIFNATTGNTRGYFNGDFSPTFWQRTSYIIHNNQLTAFDVKTGARKWKASPASGDSYSSAPVAVNGVVYVGTAGGNLLGYNANTGTLVVSMPMGAPILAYDGGGFSAPQSGLGAAQGLLVVPASTLVVALQ